MQCWYNFKANHCYLEERMSYYLLSDTLTIGAFLQIEISCHRYGGQVINII